MQCSDVAAHTTGDELREMGHFARVEQRLDDFPISRIPTDEQHAWFGHESEKQKRIGS
jgi:hypothetical protein